MQQTKGIENDSMTYKENSGKPAIRIKLEEPFNLAQPIEIRKMEKGQKLPKENIMIYSVCASKEEYGNSFSEIELINCTIQKRWQDDNTIGLDVKGEYACRCFEDMLMYIMVYNEKNDLIAYNAEQCIDEHFTRSAFFETIVYIPNVKKISKIEIRFGMSPVAVNRKGLY